MIKKLLVLALALVFGFSGTSFAAQAVVMSDSAMDVVSAGDWVVLADSEGNQSVEDVYTTNNTLWLLEESQMDLQGVNNVNAVDSAVAVQNNIASISSELPQTNVSTTQANTAEVVNYRPSSSSATSEIETEASQSTSSSTTGSASAESFALNSASSSSAASSSSSSSTSNFDYDETLDVAAAIAGDSKEIGKYGVAGGTFAGALVIDYDKTIDKTSEASSASASTETKTCVLGIVKEASSSSYGTSDSASSSSKTIEKASSSRDSKGVNNHILLDATAQKNIQAVTNLNAVGSGVAVQNNIASNVGVNGSIAQSNNASVQSGF